MRYSPYYLFYKPIRRALTTCPLPLDPPTSSASTITNDHKSLCLSLTEHLIRRGLFSSAQQVIRRIIAQSSSVTDAISTVDFATMQGMYLDSRSYGVLISKLISSGEPWLAEALYCDNIVGKGVEPDSELLNSMVICYCTLGKLEEAKTYFDRLCDRKLGLSKSACNALIRELCVQDRVLEAFDYFVGISNAGVVFRYWCYNMLIDGLSYKGYLDEAIHVFDLMSERTGLRPAVHLYKTLVYGLCKRGWVEEAEIMCNDMEAQGLFIDKTMYTSLINGYCKDKKMKMAMRLFLRMLKMGCDPDSYTYNTLIHGFVQLGLFNKGWLLYNQMAELGVKPDMVTYQVMINRYCREQKVDCALTLLNNISRGGLVPPVHCYTVVIAALYKGNRLMDVDELYKRMLDDGVVPDHVLFFTLMKYYSKGHELQLALVILRAIAKNGCGIDPSLLSNSATSDSTRDLEQEIELLIEGIARVDLKLANVAFSIFISGLCEGGKSGAALVCMDKMVSLGCMPLLSTYNSLIRCLLQEGLVEDAKSLIDIMQDQGMVPNLATYLVMINEHCKQRDLASAFDVLDQMHERELRPSVAIYDTILGCLSREKRMFEAGSMFKRMLEAGVDPDEVVYVTMINGYSKNGRAFEAMQLFDKMIGHGIRPSSRAYTALIYGLVKKNMTDKGCIYLDKMLEDGFVPETVLYTSLINQFLRKGEFEIALKLVNLMEKKKIERDFITYITLVSGLCRNITFIRRRKPIASRNSKRGVDMLFHLLHRPFLLPRENVQRIYISSPEEINDVAWELVLKIKESRYMPNLYLYNGIISGFCKAGKMEDAYDHLELMQKQGLCPNQVTFTILIDGHMRLGDSDNAIELFNTMNAYGCPPDKISYNALVKGLCKAGRLVDALSVSLTMHKRGFFPNKASYEFLLNKLCSCCLGSHAFSIFEEMLVHHFVPCRYNYNWLLWILCEENKLLEAHVVLDIMLKRGKSPYEVTKRFLFEAINKQREIDLGLHD